MVEQDRKDTRRCGHCGEWLSISCCSSLKLSVGLWGNSIAVISDAFNNLSDLGSAVVAVFGAKLSSAPARQRTSPRTRPD